MSLNNSEMSRTGRGRIRKDVEKRFEEKDRKKIQDNVVLGKSQTAAKEELKEFIKKILEKEGSSIQIDERTTKYIKNLMNQLHILDLSDLKIEGKVNENKWKELQALLKKFNKSKKKPLDRLSKFFIIYLVTALTMTLLGISGTIFSNIKKKQNIVNKMHEKFLIDPEISRDLFLETYVNIYKKKLDGINTEDFIKLKPTLFQVEDITE